MLKTEEKPKKITGNIESKRANRRLYGKEKKRKARRIVAQQNYNKNLLNVESLEKIFGKDFTYQDVIDKWLPTNLRYILKCPKSNLNEKVLRSDKIFFQKRPFVTLKVLYVPEIFSIVDKPKESFAFFKDAILNLLYGKYKSVYFSYKKCKKLDVGAQVVLDIIKKEALNFINKCRANKVISRRTRAAKEVGLMDGSKTTEEIQKILTSIGSLAVHLDTKFEFADIIPYRLCFHSRDEKYDRLRAIQQKDIDTTELADYVIRSLARFNKSLTPEKLDDLCTIIGEILINAEEHSTTHQRFSIGYFQERFEGGKHFGVFRLVILNFGKTIYEKFSEAESPNIEIIGRMRELSSRYTKRHLFSLKTFEEENLWTLYALQEGVTSVPDKRRGNGSIQFIDSFFSIKGDKQDTEEKSRMVILSGHTKIIFDGTYRIAEKFSDGHIFKVMTFNKSGNIEDMPDKKFVQYTDNYFPGTLISARILLNEDDLVDDNAD